MRSFIFLFLIGFASVANAQNEDTVATIFGDQTQPGYMLQTNVKSLVKEGLPVDRACVQTLDGAVREGATVLPDSAMLIVKDRLSLGATYVENLVTMVDLAQATRMTVETHPDQVVDVIYLGVALYPDYAQDVMNAAIVSSDISPQDALIAALSAGADPSRVATATAAGDVSSIASPPTPLGPGIGSGGAGGGDTTASDN